MKWLLDENLSYRIVRLIPKRVNVTSCTKAGLLSAEDRDLWRYAAANNMIVVTKDDDFRQLAMVHGPPPKVVWLNVGNAPPQLIHHSPTACCTFLCKNTPR